MYYSFPTKHCLDKEKFIEALAAFTGWPVAYSSWERGDGKSPFIEVNRFGDDVTLSRITHLPDEERDKITVLAEKIAKGYFPKKGRKN